MPPSPRGSAGLARCASAGLSPGHHEASPHQSCGEELRPHGDHPDEQRQRRERSGFLDERRLNMFASDSREHMRNIVLVMFCPSSEIESSDDKLPQLTRWSSTCLGDVAAAALLPARSAVSRSGYAVASIAQNRLDRERRLVELDDLPVPQRHPPVHATGESILWVAISIATRVARTSASAPRTHGRPCADRDCRSARRPAALAARWRRRGRWRRAAARRPTAPPADA